MNLKAKSPDELKNAMKLNHTIETDAKPETPRKIFYLLKNMDKYYLRIHKGHRKFEIRNNQPIAVGVIIDDEEESGGQYVTHAYRVEEIIENKYVKIVSDRSIVKTRGFEFHTTVIVEFKIDKAINGNTFFHSSIAIGFDSAVTKLFAKLIGTKGIWQQHLEEELIGGLEVIKSKDFGEDYERQKL